MKYIVKQTEPKVLTDWKAMENSAWHPTYEGLSGSVKEAIKQALMEEQGYICCYCEQELIPDNSHIEHFQPQSDPMVDALDYGNMLCSCQNQLKKGEPRHCGNAKENWFDAQLLVSPMNATCESHFSFQYDGTILPTDDDEATAETIKRLNLNEKNLKNQRKSAINSFLDSPDFTFSKVDLEHFILGVLKKIHWENLTNFGQLYSIWRFRNLELFYKQHKQGFIHGCF